MSDKPQSFESHAKMVPGYHYLGTPLILSPLLYFAYATVTDFGVAHLASLSMAAGLLVAAFYARVFALAVQDRVIRLEERLRMERVLPEELRERAADIRTEHLVGLRFASDAELPELVRRVLDGELEDRRAIKRAVKSWRPDHQRV